MDYKKQRQRRCGLGRERRRKEGREGVDKYIRAYSMGKKGVRARGTEGKARG